MPKLSETMRKIEQLVKQIRDKKTIMKEEARITKASNNKAGYVAYSRVQGTRSIGRKVEGTDGRAGCGYGRYRKCKYYT